MVTVANTYKDDAVVFPPGGDMVKGKQSIQSFWTEAAKGIQLANFKVIDVRSMGPTLLANKAMHSLRLRATTHRRWLANMWSFGKRSMEYGSSILISGT
jgi:ketosteroid isomerase-like protein